MTIERKVGCIEASLKMEDMELDSEGVERVKGILTGEISVSDAIVKLNEKYDIGAIEETLFLMSVPGMAESIIEGGKTLLEECLTEDEV